MEDVAAELKASSLWELAVAAARLDRASRIIESKLHLGTADMRLMWLLADGESRTMKEISQELHLEASTVNRQVNAAIKSGIVVRCEREGAARPIRATDEGVRLFGADVQRAMRLMGAGLAALPEHEVPGFLANLTQYAAAYRDAAEELLDELAEPAPEG